MSYVPKWLKTNIKPDDNKNYGWDYEGYKSGSARVDLTPPPLTTNTRKTINAKPMTYGLEPTLPQLPKVTSLDDNLKIYNERAGLSDKIVDKFLDIFLSDEKMNKLRSNVAENVMKPQIKAEEEARNKNINDFMFIERKSPFIHNAMEQARSAVTAGAYVPDANMKNIDTGSNLGNNVSNIIGNVAGFAMPMSGLNNMNTYKAGEVIKAPINKGFDKLAGKVKSPKLLDLTKNLYGEAAENVALNMLQSDIAGRNAEETIKSGIQGAIAGPAFYLGGKAVGALSKSAFPKWKTTYNGKISDNLKKSDNLDFRVKGELVPREGLPQLLAPTDFSTKVNELPAGTTPIEMGGYKDNIIPKVTVKKEHTNFTPMETRDFSTVSNKAVKAYQQDNPTVKPYIQSEANVLKGELERTQPGGETIFKRDDRGNLLGVNRTERITSDSIETIKAITGASYKSISKGIDNIIEDHGKENNALSKKIELILDERLNNGYYDDLTGDLIPPNLEYVKSKVDIDGTTPKIQTTPIFSGYENNKIPVKPTKPGTPMRIDAENLSKTTPIIDNTKVLPQYARENIRKPLVAQPVKTSMEEAAATTAQTLPPLNKTPIKPINDIVEVTGDIQRPEQKIVASDSKAKFSISDAWNKFYTRMVDTSNPIKKVNDKTYTLATNSKNAGGVVDSIFTNRLADRKGNKLNVSLKELAEKLPKSREDYNNFWEYMLQRHNINRAAEGKNIYPKFDSNMSAQAASKWEQLHPEWKKQADDIVKWIDDFMQEWGVKAGTVDSNVYAELRKKYPSYIPTNRDFDDIEEFISNKNGKGFVDQSTPLNKATGSSRDITDPLENIMNLVNRTVRTAKYNEVGQELLKAVKKAPQKLMSLAEIIPENEVNPNVKNIVSVLENGKEVYIRINDKPLLEAMQGIYKNSLDGADNAVKKVTNLYKSLITQKNPVFAVRNIARDIPTAYVNGSEANPLKFGRDLVKAGKELVTNSENAQRYKSVGGGGSNFFNSNNTAKSAKDLIKPSIGKRINDTIENINNIVESAPRLAEFNRVFKKTGDVQKALYAANDVTTNFSRGGDVSKKIDAYVPYFNAGIQGLDKLARQFKSKPIPTAAKGLIGITSMTLYLDHINKDNPNYKELDNRTKDNYFLFPKEDGTFVKIPKSREYGVLFGDLFERVLRSKRGDNAAYKGFGNTLGTNFSPTNPIESNIISPILNLRSNKDFANRAIVPQSMQTLSPRYQYDEKTSEIAKKLGDKANLSPKQIDYIIKSFTGVIGQLGLPAATKSNYTGDKKSNLLKPVTTQFIADPLYSNQNITDFYDNLDKADREAADFNFKNNVSSDVLTSYEEKKNGFTNVSKILSSYSKAATKASLEGNNEEARRIRAQMIQLAKEANNGEFPKGSYLKRLKENYK